MRAMAVIVVALSMACRRSPERSPMSPPAPPASDVATPAAAADDVLGPLVITSRNCGLDAVAQMIGDAGSEGGWRPGTRAIECRFSDGGGLGFAVEAASGNEERDDGARRLLVATAVMNEIGAATPDRRRREIVAMSREAGWIESGLILRAPERHEGARVRLDGVVHDVSERDGRTTMILTTDILQRERFSVYYPGIAEDWVVNRAPVRVFGIYNRALVDGAGRTVHQIFAMAIAPRAAAF